MIVLVGGRRLGDTGINDINAEFIRETHVLSMRTLEWSCLKFTGSPLAGIYNFASCVSNDGDLYIYGGTTEPL